MTLDLYSPPTARVGSLPLTNDPVLCRDLTLLRDACGRPFYGFAGIDFLKDWIIRINFDKERLDILPLGTKSDPHLGRDRTVHLRRDGIHASSGEGR